MAKPFFYKINGGKLLDFATDPEGENMTLAQFAKHLIKGESDKPFIQEVIDEAVEYMEKKQQAGKKGGKAKADNAKNTPNTTVAVAVAVTIKT